MLQIAPEAPSCSSSIATHTSAQPARCTACKFQHLHCWLQGPRCHQHTFFFPSAPFSASVCGSDCLTGQSPGTRRARRAKVQGPGMLRQGGGRLEEGGSGGASAKSIHQFAEDAEIYMQCIEQAGRMYGLQLNWNKLEVLPVRCESLVRTPNGELVVSKESLVYLGSYLSDNGSFGPELMNLKRCLVFGSMLFSQNQRRFESLKLAYFRNCYIVCRQHG